jgi:predicted extracellular nuclease
MLFTSFLNGFTFKVASYNVENLFDLKFSGNEYKEYVPYNRMGWNKKAYKAKLNNISKVIKELQAPIVALQEIESSTALKELLRTLRVKGVGYSYFAISKKGTSVKCALISKFPILKVNEVEVNERKYTRNILEVHINVKGNNFIVFVNHWKSKRGPESERIEFARALKKRISKLGRDDDYILVGDFNSNYNEHKTFKKKKRLNNTDGKTGINHTLRTVNKYGLITKPYDDYLYNLWLELPKNKRFSSKYKRKNNTLDNILIPYNLLDENGIDYVQNSFKVFDKKYLFKSKNLLNRWQIDKKHLKKRVQ